MNGMLPDRRRSRRLLAGLWLLLMGGLAPRAEAQPSNAEKCERIIHADVVAMDQCLVFNRYGTVLPDGMIFALRRDVVSNDPAPADPKALSAGQVMLRPGKRPRPIVLRANEGDCLEICLTNLLSPKAPPLQIQTREASIHVEGLEVVDDLGDDGSWTGKNGDGLASPAPAPSTSCLPGSSKTYRLFAREEGVYLLYSQAASFGQGVFSGQIRNGLFGVVLVEPKGSAWYRSQVTEATLRAASDPARVGPEGHPIVDFDKIDPDGVPILNMIKARPAPAQGPRTYDLYHSDLTAIITGPDVPGPDRWLFPPDPTQDDNPVYPRRNRPYREFAILYHDAIGLSPPFDYGKALKNTMGAGEEAFAINYGSVGIGTEVWANRIGVGPMAEAVDAKFEEFFLSSWVCGDPAVLVDVPANTPNDAPPPPAHPKPACPPGTSTPRDKLPGPKATVAFYPDDPSNVYHSYLNDRVKFRVLHAGANIVHVHHQHAHQWLKTPASNESKLLDSQTITPGVGFTLEMIYGSGNRNLTPGDSIFHCHFYPHFAAGLWALWRVHDVFEAGTRLDEDGRPLAGARALPDGEIARGTPIPGLVPMPTLAMAPLPAGVRLVAASESKPKDSPGRVGVGYNAELADPERDRDRNPGYPFFIPGIAGRRAPQPPFDFARDELTNQPLDGGLPRHVILGGTVEYQKQTPLDFTRENITRDAQGKVTQGFLVARELPSEGTPVERRAMAYHERGEHPSARPDGQPATFLTNGGHRRPGAPYADPAVNPWDESAREQVKQGTASRAMVERLKVEDYRDPVEKSTIVYKAADIQLDVVFNKKGWHYPQQRILSLWGDVQDVLAGRRSPEPLFFRSNSNTVIEYWLTNLIPAYYELDDFQVRTPTDMIGQHIHLVKFDVTSSDGAANGFNYQDGSYSPEEVRNRIDAINAGGGLYTYDLSGSSQLKARATPFFGNGPVDEWLGAQTTVQAWYADRLLDREPPKPRKKPGYRQPVATEGTTEPEDRTLQSVFTHDHFSPSTHQQVGLYAGLIVEPDGTRWYDPRTGERMGGRLAKAYNPSGPPTFDGGPTSWQALIVPDNLRSRAEQSSREFVLEFQDFQLAYNHSSIPKAVPYARYSGSSPPDGKTWGWMDPTNAIAPPGSVGGAPTLISTPPETGGRVINYRAEPLPFRTGVGSTIQAPLPDDQDLAQAFRSIARKDPDVNVQPTGPIAPTSPFRFPGPFVGAGPFDPYTPLLRAYENDRVRLRVMVGAHHNGHVFNLQGLKWLTEPSYLNSGYRSNQVMSISEHFEMDFTLPAATVNAPDDPKAEPPSADYLYRASSDIDGTAQGLWGLIRSYRGAAPDLVALPNNPPNSSPARNNDIKSLFANEQGGRKVRKYFVAAVAASKVSGDPAGLVYNQRYGRSVVDPDALVYVKADETGAFPPSKTLEPLVLRANSGDLIELTLFNRFDPKAAPPPGRTNNVFNKTRTFQSQGLAFGPTPANVPNDLQGATSTRVGLHPQLLAFDINTSNGFNVGRNSVQTVEPNGQRTYQWYAGDLGRGNGGSLDPIPIEFGTVGLAPADPMFQHPHGLVGALIIEPEGSEWSESDTTSATITPRRPAPSNGGKVPDPFREFVLVMQDQVDNSVQIPDQSVPNTTGLQSVNYANEAMLQRFNPGPNKANFNSTDVAQAVANVLVPMPPPGSSGPTGADPQTPILLAEAGQPARFRLIHPGGNSYSAWAVHGHSWERDPFQAESTVLAHNPLSEQVGAVAPFGPLDQADVLIDQAGGRFAIPGDYLFRSVLGAEFANGAWGLFRVVPKGSDVVSLQTLTLSNGQIQANGVVRLVTGKPPAGSTVQLVGDAGPIGPPVTVAADSGSFAISGPVPAGAKTLTVVSSGKGSATITFVTTPNPQPNVAAQAEVPPDEAQRQRASSFIRRGSSPR